MWTQLARECERRPTGRQWGHFFYPGRSLRGNVRELEDDIRKDFNELEALLDE
jgi:hypothetical protein